MANVKISDLTAKGAALAADDLLEMELAAGGSRKLTGTEVANGVNTLLGLASAYQPLDADLTAIAALTPTNGNVITGNGSAWTSAAPAPGGGLKNTVINGNFDIWQRGVSFTAPASNTYTADRWAHTVLGTGVFDILRSTDVPDGASDYSFRVDVTTADASIAAGDRYGINYRVEGYDAMRYAFGTAAAKQLTLSFWVKSPKTGTHCVSFRNSADDRSYVATYTVNAADTWEYKTITLTADTAGASTWLTDNGIGLRIAFALATGSTSQDPAGGGVWRAGNYFATAAQVNCMDNVANNFHLSRVQLEEGAVATAFERRPYAQELALAKRYYQIYVDPPLRGISSSTTNYTRIGIMLPVEMRAAPTASLTGTMDWYDGSVSGTLTSFSTSYTQPHSVEFDGAVATSTTAAGRPFAVFNGTNNGSLKLDAEL